VQIKGISQRLPQRVGRVARQPSVGRNGPKPDAGSDASSHEGYAGFSLTNERSPAPREWPQSIQMRTPCERCSTHSGQPTAVSASVKVSRTPARDTLAPRTGPVSEKQQCPKSRLLRWCNALSVPRAAPYGDWALPPQRALWGGTEGCACVRSCVCSGPDEGAAWQGVDARRSAVVTPM
jgi:hypothetical protein